MKNNKKILFLYTELAGYFLACIDKLSTISKPEIHIVHFPINKEAPFQFDFPNDIKFYERNKYNNTSLVKLVSEINPDIIICSGWIDKGYLKICKKYFKKIPTVISLDNPWEGNIKQSIATLISPYWLLNRFSHIWIPGTPQLPYAKALGFKEHNIKTGYYCCDTSLFTQYYLNNKEEKTKHLPKRFIYVGRYIENKGIKDLWDAFIQLHQEIPNEWELWCLGAGPLEKEKPTHAKIKHFGFKQPNDIGSFIQSTGIFVLPSHFEPWGVAIHEFTTAGFPIICSDKVGSASQFLQENINGYSFKSQNRNSLKHAMTKIIKLSEQELNKMAIHSNNISKEITLDTWSKTLKALLASKWLNVEDNEKTLKNFLLF